MQFWVLQIHIMPLASNLLKDQVVRKKNCPESLANKSCIHGIGSASKIVILFKARMSIQNLNDSSFLRTITIGEENIHFEHLIYFFIDNFFSMAYGNGYTNWVVNNCTNLMLYEIG